MHYGVTDDSVIRLLQLVYTKKKKEYVFIIDSQTMIELGSGEEAGGVLLLPGASCCCCCGAEADGRLTSVYLRCSPLHKTFSQPYSFLVSGSERWLHHLVDSLSLPHQRLTPMIPSITLFTLHQFHHN